MALNSQFIASIFSARNENSFSLANASVDFALVRVEVPKQFEGLGNALSQHRRQNAESGSQHRIARRLGALFEQIIPNIEILTAAYGERASEIATSPLFDLKNVDHGPFSGHVGVDGTSIYAAVSSGPSIIALHLLACMLARMFSNVEATAIWMQLVDGRLKDLERASETSQIQGLAALYAAEQGRQILRDDLASWDASARAWLQTANEVKKREDTQLKLIVKNIPSIHSSGTTYSNVVENWILAMKTAQDLIQGVPQDVTNGSVILGLMSWHIYPDLNVFSPNRDVKFNDRLVKPGGVITLGLEAKEKNCSGVSWSVSLSHLRFYGDPVVIEKRFEEDSDRITVEELRYITFGCVLGSWAQPASIYIEEAAECFSALGEAIGYCSNSTDDKSYDIALGWITPLIDTANSFLSAVEKERETALYFIEFGRRRGRNFLDDKFRDIVPMFGLLNPYLLFRLSPDFFEPKFDEAAQGGFSYEGNWEYASAVPIARQSRKRAYGGEPQVIQRIGAPEDFTGYRMKLPLCAFKAATVLKQTKRLVTPIAHVRSKGSNALHSVCAYQLLRARSEFYSAQTFEAVSPPQEYAQNSCSTYDSTDEQYGRFINSLEEPEYQYHPPCLRNATEPAGLFWSVEANGTAALLLRNSAEVKVPSYTLPKLTAILRSSALDPSFLREYLEELPETGIMDCSDSLDGVYQQSALFFRSLRAISAISDLYSDWPGATMSIGITKQPIGRANWATNVFDQTEREEEKFWRAIKFSCLAMLESGGCDLHPDQVKHVMAMATGNSIYTSEALLQDPALQDHSGKPPFKGIRRIHGNLGYPGVVMLIPPPVPRVLQANSMRGRFVQAASFDGQPKNSFTQTSLHLKLTDYKVPLANARGAVDADIVMREALMSVYDGSRWVADLDIIRALQSQDLTRFFGCSCVRDDVDNKTLCQLLADKFGNQLKVITSWEELLLYQENLMVGEFGTVLVYGSWFARLAVTTVAFQMKYPAITLPSHCICFQCGQKILGEGSWTSPVKESTSPLLFII
ncbi:hypothetical protein TRIATDRAFT_320993 [Trichoderma atroviride IMI 206040]|uniref:Uncharacterized protein n=1 Tax=Hypocrea atroviridis (strain ATCC 20476 / IMI 206040) TaxID=452589 RepID=G9P6W5_HYPAI|nr:uncharacterized protein TRIATDRAFT_320993 [Trichoderma atroviride IMI 206040]EHK40690.1 hypothetical protein TRIATDRAFT_320993 [Trichoderma atroviride IMI 206040]